MTDPLRTPPKLPLPPVVKVTCPDCGSKDAVIVYTQSTERGCVCTKCHFSWVTTHSGPPSVS